MTPKPYPSDIQAEQAVLAACLINPQIIKEMQGVLSPDDMYREAHVYLLQAIYVLKDALTPITLSAELTKRGHLEAIGGDDYLFTLSEAISTSAGWRYHAEIVKALADRRKMMAFCSVALEKGFVASNEQEEILSELKTAIIDLQSGKEPDYVTPLQCVQEIHKQIERKTESGDHSLGLLTGFTDIDKFCNLEPRQTYYLKGKSKSGKSALALQVCDQILSRYPTGYGLYFTLESDRQALTFRRLSRVSQIALTRLLKGEMRGEWEWERLNTAENQLADSRLIVFDQSKFKNIEVISSVAQTFKLNHPILFVVIDFIQIMSARGKYQSKHDKYGSISETLNYLAKDLDCPIVTLSQVNTEGQAKESGDIENNAGHVWHLEREPEEKQGRLTGEKGKNIGTWGPIWLSFDRFTQTFSDYIGE